jgi:hypothetical protein
MLPLYLEEGGTFINPTSIDSREYMEPSNSEKLAR